MRRRQAILTAASAAVLSQAPAPALADDAGPVVLELFTSQGCSSCPPADALLAELASRPDVVALGWHVDYWNNLGWRDPFASPAWTQRQRHYAGLLRDEVYTPALVVNGARMVVGSDRAAVRAAIAAAVPLRVGASLARRPNGLAARIQPGADTPLGSLSVLLIVYDADHLTPVRAGENAGRMLREINVVRAATPLDVTAVSAGLVLPDVAAGQGAVLLVQDKAGVVAGAARIAPLGA